MEEYRKQCVLLSFTLESENRALTIFAIQVDSPFYPPPSARLSCAKLFLELSQHVPALEILQTLEGEDDEDSETWYLSGWAWWLLGESRAGKPSTDTEESKEECWSEAKLCLENYLKVSTFSVFLCRFSFERVLIAFGLS